MDESFLSSFAPSRLKCAGWIQPVFSPVQRGDEAPFDNLTRSLANVDVIAAIYCWDLSFVDFQAASLPQNNFVCVCAALLNFNQGKAITFASSFSCNDNVVFKVCMEA